MHGYFLRDTQPASKGRRGGTHKQGQLGPKDGIFIDFFSLHVLAQLGGEGISKSSSLSVDRWRAYER